MMPSAWSVGTFGWWTSQLSGMWKMLPLNSWKSRAPFGWFIGQKFRGQMLNFPWGYDLPVNNWAGSIRNSVFLLFWVATIQQKYCGLSTEPKGGCWQNIDIYHIWWVNDPEDMVDATDQINKKISSLWKKKKENKSSSNEESTSLSKWIEAG